MKLADGGWWLLAQKTPVRPSVMFPLLACARRPKETPAVSLFRDKNGTKITRSWGLYKKIVIRRAQFHIISRVCVSFLFLRQSSLVFALILAVRYNERRISAARCQPPCWCMTRFNSNVCLAADRKDKTQARRITTRQRREVDWDTSLRNLLLSFQRPDVFANWNWVVESPLRNAGPDNAPSCEIKRPESCKTQIRLLSALLRRATR